MSTIRQIITHALKSIRVIQENESPSASAMSDSLDTLNTMIFGWTAEGVDVLLQDDFALSDELVFWVPPRNLDPEFSRGTVMDSIAYQGTWDASTNTPTLGSSDGTKGYVYKVSAAGSTALDSVTSWSADDYLVYNGVEWLKGLSARRHERGIIAMLAEQMASDFGLEVPRGVAQDARKGWMLIQGDFIKPGTASMDTALLRLPSRRWGNASLT